MNKKELIRKANEVGIHFFHSFYVEEGIAIGSEFSTDSTTWVVGRIDNVVVKNGLMLVEGYCIRKLHLTEEVNARRINVGQTVTSIDDFHGKVISSMNGIIGIELENGEVVYRYEKQIAKLY